MTVPPEVIAKFRENMLQDLARRQEYGDIPPVISVPFAGQRLVAVGNEILHSKEWNTFADFLIEYARRVLGHKWWGSQMALRGAKRHTILRWHDEVLALTNRTPKGPDGLRSAVWDGEARAFLLLSYDLYVLRVLNKLQAAVVERLKQNDQFVGARYELFVAATCCKAGFDIDYEDESDNTDKHPEFKAIHRATGESVAVEAKCQLAVLPTQNQTDAVELPRASIRRLLRRALEKPANCPYVVFLGLQLPLRTHGPSGQTWTTDLEHIVIRVAGDPNVTKTKHNLIVMTGLGLLFGRPRPIGPPGMYYGFLSPNPIHPARVPSVLRNVYEAVAYAGRVPNRFAEDDEPSVSTADGRTPVT